MDLALLKAAMRRDGKGLFVSRVVPSLAHTAGFDLAPVNVLRFAVMADVPNLPVLLGADVTIRVTDPINGVEKKFTLYRAAVDAARGYAVYTPLHVNFFDVGPLIWGRWEVDTNSVPLAISFSEVLFRGGE